MKKTVFTVLALIAVTLVLASCSNKDSSAFKFSKDTLKAKSGDTEITISYNTRVTITDNQLNSTVFGGGDIVSSEGDFELNGVKIGDRVDSFISAFALSDNNAMWETCLVIDDEEVLFNYPAYTAKDYKSHKINFNDYDDIFLTVGFYTEKGSQDSEEWKVLDYNNLYQLWNLEQPKYKEGLFEDVCFISAGLDENGTINMLDVYYGSFESFAENEQYSVDIDYFANEDVTSVEE